MKAKDIIIENSYKEKGEQFPFMVVRSDIALNAVKAAKEEVIEKAISTYKYTCSFSPDGCCQIKNDAGKCDCENLNDFIEELTK